MKIHQFFSAFTLLFAVSGMFFVSGCNADAAQRGTEAAHSNSESGATAAETHSAAAAAASSPNSGLETAATVSENGSELGLDPQTGAASIAVPPPAPIGPTDITPELEPVIQLIQAGVEETVLIGYIEQQSHYQVTVDDIVYLNDLGTPASVIMALIDRSGGAPTREARYSGQYVQINNTNSGTNTNSAPVDTHDETEETGEAIVSGNANPAVRQAVSAAQTVEYAPQPAADVQTVYVEVPQQEVTTTYFQESLAPYGTWVTVADYGPCWRPTVAVVDPHWRPYHHHGRWLYTDYGWYWNSDYSWGWAPFHYGRWHRHHHHGWLWSPGHVWGPAWVSWRRSSGYYGWAPLPPAAHYSVGFGFSYHGSRVGLHFDFGLAHHDYTFIGHHHFHHRHPWNYYAPATRVTNIYDNSTVVNNYITDSDNNVINVGIGDRDEVASATRREIKKVAIRDLDADNLKLIKPDQLRDGGKTVAVYRPKLPPAPGNPDSPTTRTGGRGELVKSASGERSGSSAPTRNPGTTIAPRSASNLSGAATSRPATERFSGAKPGLSERGSAEASTGAPRQVRQGTTRPISRPGGTSLVSRPDDGGAATGNTTIAPRPGRSTTTERPSIYRTQGNTAGSTSSNSISTRPGSLVKPGVSGERTSTVIEPSNRSASRPGIVRYPGANLDNRPTPSSLSESGSSASQRPTIVRRPSSTTTTRQPYTRPSTTPTPAPTITPSRPDTSRYTPTQPVNRPTIVRRTPSVSRQSSSTYQRPTVIQPRTTISPRSSRPTIVRSPQRTQVQRVNPTVSPSIRVRTPSTRARSPISRSAPTIRSTPRPSSSTVTTSPSRSVTTRPRSAASAPRRVTAPSRPAPRAATSGPTVRSGSVSTSSAKPRPGSR